MITMTDRYSTESLQADIDNTNPLSVRNFHPRQAEQLLKLDTPQRRKRAAWDAHTRQNLRGGILSQNIAEAVRELLDRIASDTEDAELWGERVAREAREREAELRQATGNPNAIYYPPELRR